MPDDTTKRGPADRRHINVHQDHEMRYWCGVLHVSPQELRAAVARVGTNADLVRKELGK
jgi:hypothetical protein